MSSKIERNPTSESAAATTDKMADVAHQKIDDTAERIRPVEQKIRSSAESASEKLDETNQAAAQTMRNTTAKAESFVKEQPLTAAGIAFAAGLLAAAVLRR